MTVPFDPSELQVLRIGAEFQSELPDNVAAAVRVLVNYLVTAEEPTESARLGLERRAAGSGDDVVPVDRSGTCVPIMVPTDFTPREAASPAEIVVIWGPGCYQRFFPR